jgi:hypothetical protein
MLIYCVQCRDVRQQMLLAWSWQHATAHKTNFCPLVRARLGDKRVGGGGEAALL